MLSQTRHNSLLGPLIAASLALMGFRIAVLVRDVVLSHHANDAYHSLGLNGMGPDPYFNNLQVEFKLSYIVGVALLVRICVESWRRAQHSWASVLLFTGGAVFGVAGFVGPLSWIEHPVHGIDQYTDTGGYVLALWLDCAVAAVLVIVLIAYLRSRVVTFSTPPYAWPDQGASE